MASVDRGNTAYVGSVHLQISTASDLSTPDTSHGNYNQKTSKGPDSDKGTTVYFVSGGIGADLSLPAPPGTYKMTGWYATGSVWESWVVTTPDTTPPSGHTLTFITYSLLVGGSSN